MSLTTFNRPMSAAEWGMLIALSILWGGSFFFVGIAVEQLPPFTIVVMRVALAALALWVVVGAMRVRIPRDGRVWAAFLGMGLLNNVAPFCLIVWGQTHIATGLAAILNATTPLFAVIVAHFLTSDEKMTGPRLTGVVVGFAGIIIMVGGSVFQSLGIDVLAQVACLAAAISYAFAGVFGRRFRAMGVPALATATGQLTASTLVLLPIMLLVDQPWTLAMPGAETIGALFGLAMLSTAIAYILYFRILATAGATNLLLVTLLIPVSAILLGAVVLGERLELRQFAGMAMIGAGLACIDGRPIRLMRRLAAGRAT